MLKRDSYTNEPLSFTVEQLQSFKYEKRLENHPYSEKSKARGGANATEAVVSEGSIIHLKNEGSKHTTRDFYLVLSIYYI